MNVDIIVATCGDDSWRELAAQRAAPSAFEEAASGQYEFATVHVEHHPDLALAEARNRAAFSCRLHWLCFVDADDELEPGYLDAMAAAYQAEVTRSSAATAEPLLIPAVRYVYDGRQEEARIPNKGGWPRVNEAVIGTLVHRQVFEAVGGFRTHTDDRTPISIYEDWDLWLRCVDAGSPRVYVEAAVYRAHVNRAGGRNVVADPTPVYDAIWRDHMKRREP